MTTRMIRPEELDAFFVAKKNLLFIGKHGVGKTSKIKVCFEKHGLIRNSTYLYFSASTLDPWVDLIGVPKETKDKSGIVCLDLVRPKALATGKVEAIFFDELNRSPKKVRNAVMELLQFKSINGLEFPNLKVIWAAINPDTEDDIYDVEKLDPAQKGRFHAWVDIPYECDKDYFVSRFGANIALPALEWWNALPEAIKNEVDPRRLDYALEAFQSDLPLEFILPESSNINKLIQVIKTGPIEEKLISLMNAKDISNAKMFLANANNFDAAMRFVIGNDKMMEFFLPLAPKERLITLISKEDKVRSFVTAQKHIQAFTDVIRDVLLADENDELCKKLRRSLGGNINPLTQTAKSQPGAAPAPEFSACLKSHYDFDRLLQLPIKTSQHRAEAFSTIKKNIPASSTLSSEDAIIILNVLNEIISNSFPSVLLNSEYEKLTGIINTCIASMAKEGLIGGNSPFNLLADLLKNYPNYQHMFDKVGVAGLLNEIKRN